MFPSCADLAAKVRFGWSRLGEGPSDGQNPAQFGQGNTFRQFRTVSATVCVPLAP
jgi:hypothetical protein